MNVNDNIENERIFLNDWKKKLMKWVGRSQNRELTKWKKNPNAPISVLLYPHVPLSSSYPGPLPLHPTLSSAALGFPLFLLTAPGPPPPVSYTAPGHLCPPVPLEAWLRQRPVLSIDSTSGRSGATHSFSSSSILHPPYIYSDIYRHALIQCYIYTAR